ncbi:bile acid:Na+ symporter, BASS family [Pseudonocardia ammonioxydans]|uniref:Bile acid:Na+ symporter, BASS family n=1 Tax=Pseudonocardia ammonioxydans TaxID=260086 RepID=A0A1I4VN33_PSUAM|nr:bile acid:sodium symporter family protein [Pseudonocardia ammonioxydans]SFN02654.1 bile acid:Na+ symporter, BASS family [Pseudonocardia ammonioxydans]
MQRIEQVGDVVGRWFPVIVLIAGAIAMAVPETFASWSPAVPWLLAVIMLGMGMTLRPVDFAYIARRPVAFVIGLCAQYVVMPALGWLLTVLVDLPPEIAVGVILVACAPGGTASNVMVFLARGDVALSVAMTSVSTLVAPIVTPLLVLLLAGRFLPVSPGEMFFSIVQIVLVPVILGFLLRRWAGGVVDRVTPALPLVSVVGITAVVLAVVAGAADSLLTAGLVIVGVVVVHNLAGLALGYAVARAFGLDIGARRAVAIEVGMQNSGLAATLGTVHFGPAAALPGAVFSVWHNVSGAALAGYWSRRPVVTEPQDSTTRGG